MARHRLPSLTALRIFEAVARSLSFTKAAAELGITQAAVSRQIKALEQDLAVRLIRRGAKGNDLTDAGEILFSGVYQALGAIEQSVERITGSGDRQILHVSVAPYFSASWLTPRLMRFIAAHPEIDLRLTHAYHPADHRREGIDLGINWGSGDWPGVAREKLLDGSLTAVLSPALLARIGPLRDPAQLLDQTLLFEFDIQHWQAWCAAAGCGLPAMTRHLRLSDSHALRRAALDGHGVMLFFAALIAEDVAAGRLVQPFTVTAHVGDDYYLNYPEDIELTAKAKAFRRWLQAEIAGT
jgi:DNA-binding transcriptional LysR family regulator